MGRDADSFYVEDCRNVQCNTHAIQTLTGKLSRLLGTLEGENDFQQCRRMIDEAVRHASETKIALVRIREYQHQAQTPAEKNHRRMMYRKLSDSLTITARVLEDVVRRFATDEKKYLASLESASVSPLATASLASPVEQSCDDVSPLGDGDVAGGSDRQSMLEKQFEQEMKRDKCLALTRIDDDIQCLHGIYTDLAQAVDWQQPCFDSLESHMEMAVVDIERGKEEIRKNRGHWTQRFKRKLLYVGGGAIMVFLIGSVVSPS